MIKIKQKEIKFWWLSTYYRRAVVSQQCLNIRYYQVHHFHSSRDRAQLINIADTTSNIVETNFDDENKDIVQDLLIEIGVFNSNESSMQTADNSRSILITLFCAHPQNSDLLFWSCVATATEFVLHKYPLSYILITGTGFTDIIFLRMWTVQTYRANLMHNPMQCCCIQIVYTLFVVSLL